MQLALIVDDSKTARVMLGRMLDRLKIPTAMVESAEDALKYLESHRPDVIFMDHMMPGMDGFQAVKAIKADPEKSTIPIVMHTTQQGDIYVGQARALGASDILTKPTTDQGLREVLERISTSLKGGGKPDQKDISETPVNVRETASSRAVTIEAPIVDMSAIAAVQAQASDSSFWGSARQWLMAFIWLIPSIWLFALYLTNQQQITALEQDKQALLETVEWSLAGQSSYDYGEQPMSGERLVLLSTIMPMLKEAGFEGSVLIEGHVGEFCLSRLPMADGSTQFMLPSPELNLGECDVIGTSVPRAMSMSIAQSNEFGNYIQAFNAENDDIRLELVPYGAKSPREAYPADITNISIGDWNAVALNNNWVNFVLIAK